MSAVSQLRAQEPEAVVVAEGKGPLASSADRDNPIELLRDAIARLKNSGGDLADQSQLATLLAEAREALEHANVIAGAISQCQEHLREARFEKALEALDAGLLAYPGDPNLTARRADVEAQQEAFRDATVVRMALEEADWFIAQDRTDLATQHLKEKAAALPGQTDLFSRLKELEEQLSAWQQKRDVQAALAQSGALEQAQQWQAALTVLEEALQGHPDSEELLAAAIRVQDQLVEHERQKKLARRVELIRQKIAAQSWKQASTLLETARIEFPGADQLEALRCEVDAGLKRSECDSIATEVRQWLADGELDHAELVLSRARQTLGPEPALELLRGELAAEKQYRDALRAAQVLFGKRQFDEAERILTQLLHQDRSEPRALLDAVRGARAATEEESFFDKGRERAVELIQQQQFAQAEDLLRNLLSLFPGNPLLQRDLKAAQSGLSHRPAEIPETVEEPVLAPPPLAPAKPPLVAKPRPVPAAKAAESVRESASPRSRRKAAAAAGLFVLSSAGGAAWVMSNRTATVPRSATVPPAKQVAAVTVDPVPQQSAPTSLATPAPEPPKPSTTAPPIPAAKVAAARETRGEAAPARTAPLRQFVSPSVNPAAAQRQNPAVVLPPAADAIVTAVTLPALPADLMRGRITVPAPEAPPPAASAAPAAAPATGGRVEQAVLVTRVLPLYPDMSRRGAVSGTVKLDAVVDERGYVKDVKVVSGDAVLGQAAKNAVLKWIYKPSTLNGKPIATNVQIQIVFGDRNK